MLLNDVIYKYIFMFLDPRTCFTRYEEIKFWGYIKDDSWNESQVI